MFSVQQGLPDLPMARPLGELLSSAKLRGSHPRQIERGGILLLGAALLLHVAVRKAEVYGVVDHPAVFVGGDAAVDARALPLCRMACTGS